MRIRLRRCAPSSSVSYTTPCTHGSFVLLQIRHDTLLRAGLPSPAVRPGDHVSGSFVIAGPPTAPVFHPVRAVLSAMHRGDLLLLSASTHAPSEPAQGLQTLPVNPYPVQPGTAVRAHLVADKPPPPGGRDADGWTPWVGGTWRKWARGTVLGYKDFAGREAKVSLPPAFIIRCAVIADGGSTRSRGRTTRSRTCTSTRRRRRGRAGARSWTRRAGRWWALCWARSSVNAGEFHVPRVTKDTHV